MKGIRFKRTWPLVLVSALVVLGLSAVMYGVAAASPKHAFWQSLCESLGGALLSIGALGLVYDLALRRSFGRDLLSIVQLKASISNTGVQSIGFDEPDWEAFYGKGSALMARPLAPDTWLDRHFDSLISAAVNTSASVAVHLPRGGSHASSALAKLHQRASVSAFDSAVSHEWMRSRERWCTADPAVKAKSGLGSFVYDEHIPFGLFVNDNSYVIELPAPSAKKRIYVIVENSLDRQYLEWLSQHRASTEVSVSLGVPAAWSSERGVMDQGDGEASA